MRLDPAETKHGVIPAKKRICTTSRVGRAIAALEMPDDDAGDPQKVDQQEWQQKTITPHGNGSRARVGRLSEGRTSNRRPAHWSYFLSGKVSSFWLVSTTKTASSFAGLVVLPFALTPWRSPGISEKLSPAL